MAARISGVRTAYEFGHVVLDMISCTEKRRNRASDRDRDIHDGPGFPGKKKGVAAGPKVSDLRSKV